MTPWLFVGYVAVVGLQSRLDRKDGLRNGEGTSAEVPADSRLLAMSDLRFYGSLAVLAVVIVLCGIWLATIGDRMALPRDQGGFGLGQSFVGTFFLAISTSLPELVVCLAAIRMGLLDMALGNVLGSNMLNLAIIFAADIGLRGASILHYASSSHLVTAGMILMLTSVGMMGLQYRSKRHLADLGIDVWLMVLIYIIGSATVFIMS